jgi:hypothetical protein
MTELSQFQIFGAWISIFLTLCILSFLYEDNPVYKLAEHLFLGVSIGISVTEQYYGVFKPNLIDKLGAGNWLSIIPLVMLLLLLFKGVAGFSSALQKHTWVARIPIAFMVAAYAGVKLTGEANANLMTQVAQTMPNLAESWATNGLWSWANDGAGVFSDLILVLGLIACLVHFYFSKVPDSAVRFGGIAALGAFVLVGLLGLALVGSEMEGAGLGARIFVSMLLGVCAAAPFLAFSEYKPWVSRFGILMLMLSFGASFGYTVMGRISLAIGRAQEMLGLNRPAVQVEQIHPQIATVASFVVIVAFLVVWRRRGGGPQAPTPS